MGRLDNSGKVIDLAHYRALRTAKSGGQRRARYVLWYPGLGYLRPQHRQSASPGSAIRPA